MTANVLNAPGAHFLRIDIASLLWLLRLDALLVECVSRSFLFIDPDEIWNCAVDRAPFMCWTFFSWKIRCLKLYSFKFCKILLGVHKTKTIAHVSRAITGYLTSLSPLVTTATLNHEMERFMSGVDQAGRLIPVGLRVRAWREKDGLRNFCYSRGREQDGEILLNGDLRVYASCRSEMDVLA